MWSMLKQEREKTPRVESTLKGTFFTKGPWEQSKFQHSKGRELAQRFNSPILGLGWNISPNGFLVHQKVRGGNS